MPNPIDFSEFVAGFLVEADEHLHSINHNLVLTAAAHKRGVPEPRAVRELFRSLHTIKGLASMVGAEPLVAISHEMESILRVADRSGGRLSESALDVLIQGTRAIEERVHAFSKLGLDKIPPAPASLLEKLTAAQDPHEKAPNAAEFEIDLPAEVLKLLSASEREQLIQARSGDHRPVLVEFQPSAERAKAGFSITSVRERLRDFGELVKVIPFSSKEAPTGIAFFLLLISDAPANALAEVVNAPDTAVREVAVKGLAPSPARADGDEPEADHSADWSPSDHGSIRVDVRKLDAAMERLAELVITRYKMSRVAASLAASGADTRDLNLVLAENSRQLKRLRAAITEARMVPLSELLQRLPLVARGLTKDSDKSVNVEILAGSAEVDKSVADKIFPAIVHLVRNAVDHAIETREERKRAGKPEAGTLTITCDDSSGTSLAIKVSDDGRGINRDAVARRTGQAVARTNEELLDQITIPGMSTREEVTTTSGRGMGMDIVKRAVVLLGGVLSLESPPGKGTTFTLRVPVSVTIIDVFSFLSHGQVFVAPVAMIEEIIEVDPANIVNAPMPSYQGTGSRLIRHRETTIPLFDLDALLKRKSETAVNAKALVVQQGSGTIAFGVDRMLGQQEVVVRPLDDLLFRLPGMVGATDLGDGRPTLVLDLATLGAALSKTVGEIKHEYATRHI